MASPDPIPAHPSDPVPPEAAPASPLAEEPAPPSLEAETPAPASEKRKRGRKRKEPGEEKDEEKPKRERKMKVFEKSVERPSRERKTVVRLIQMSPPKAPVSKVLTILQGPGTKLKDIPNVSFKLSKRKIDENLQVLHSVLFGKKSNAHYLKRNISQFSGFVWAGNEEKMRMRIKEKLDKFTRDRLLDFSELLDIQIARTTSKKEEITEKLLEFLESPHATRDTILENEKKGKRKRKSKGVDQHASGGASSEGGSKKRKSSPDTEGKPRRKKSDKIKKEDDNEEGGLDKKEEEGEHGSNEEEDAEEVGSDNKDDLSSAGIADGDTDVQSDHVKSEENDGDEPEENVVSTNGSDEKEKVAEPKTKEKVSAVKKNRPAKSDQSSLKPVPKSALSDDDDVPSVPARSKKRSAKGKTDKKEKATSIGKGSTKSLESTPKSSRRKSKITADNNDIAPSSSAKSNKENKKKRQSNDEPVPKDNKAVEKPVKVASKVSTKEQGKGKTVKKAKVEPTREELQSVVSNILKEVDFNTATLADILKQLGAHFNTNVMDRKAEVKQIIQEVINSMSDDEEGSDDAGDVDGSDDANEDDE